MVAHAPSHSTWEGEDSCKSQASLTYVQFLASQLEIKTHTNKQTNKQPKHYNL